MINKKGDIWVSAVLYIALGMIVITLILGAGLPLIAKMKDKNTITQTKKMMSSFDDTILNIAQEGPGSRRVISPLEIGSGRLIVNTDEDYIEWKMLTRNRMYEPDIEFAEGNVKSKLVETIIEDEYEMIIYTNYTGTSDIVIPPNNIKGPFNGRYALSITHSGNFNNKGEPQIELVFV